METQAKFTIFALWNDGSSRQGGLCFFPPLSGEPEALMDRIEFTANFIQPDNFVPIAWVAKSLVLGTDDFTTEAAESIAAGRVIEKVDGVWVARGVEEKKEELSFFTGTEKMLHFVPSGFTNVCVGDWLFLNGSVHLVTQVGDTAPESKYAIPERPITALDAAMIARDGPAKPAPVRVCERTFNACRCNCSDGECAMKPAAKPPIAGLTRTNACGLRDHLVSAQFGSAELIR